MDNREKWLFLTCLLPSTILGSAASNLYNTTFLQKNPFPDNYGHEGDVAWGIENANKIRLAVFNKECTSFVVHERESILSAELQSKKFTQLCELAKKSISSLATKDTNDAFILGHIRAEQMASLWTWICSVESAQVERLKYISILEKEHLRLKSEISQLSHLRIFPDFVWPTRGGLFKILRPLRRFYSFFR